ncbi:UDP-N-acetylglucosamine pyrophosphorylase related protein [Oleidesulfovibrio alaskensis G20]|jgi:choline kinase|uniref:UDP-N-acetylglucosamine pyrophosphorylase related protein n=1 Tax=Oleidesulfovibrio alaskensis (strain ATCC BAA-1058 / DSM 17464 / G20) TaxID=207559 RepID=Q316A7_OLEA2|nr:phosphocholine cytidylyltransferase family protein [Oleidesulfovibrio alaskensis]ABB37239.1 UDP-N-acetylglucosamine pyrophosphorylase related protein [Oleidesulfovibrio alaskensis G20]MBG0772576.1 phosphocholine cytidylyltransferase family protein [Oleidesulfovibrio alaskensis]MBL3583034.1 phosphocholine cytidylyltransferase family protein [Oleidesulfovibrio alaskensis]
MKAVILAAGVGSRLGRPFPKSLSRLPSGECILGRQIRILREIGIREVHVVVGFKKSLLMEEFPNVCFRYNPVFYITNTSKSLLAGIEDLDDDILWANGDVVFDPEVALRLMQAGGNAVAVDRKKCGEEEVKYRTDAAGFITAISKQVENPEGEAVGLNLVSRGSLPDLVAALESCRPDDYFERALEMLVEKTPYRAVDISDYRCIEVDFKGDLDEARRLFNEGA